MRKKDWLKAVCLLAALMMLCAAVAAESYSAGTMRLLRFQGEVGKQRLLGCFPGHQ